MVLPLALALSIPIGLTPVAADGAGGLGRPDLPEQRVTKVRPVTGQGAKQAREQVAEDLRDNAAQALRARAEQRRASWPKAGTADLTLTASATKAAPGGLPVAVTPLNAKNGLATGTDTTFTVLDQGTADRLGITGVVLTAEAETAGTAEVSVDYGAFASAVGGGWSGRLRLVQLPACSLTTPQKAECRTPTPLASRNDAKEQTVTARVTVAESDSGPTTQLGAESSGATVMALTASGSGGSSPKGTGDYSATPLSASSSWAAGASSGSFTWSYGFTLPPAAAGPAPALGLSYDSGSIDGRTATTNNQGTSVGEGFSLTESYIERSYGSCDDDGHTDVFDRCWKYDNARLVLNGKSSRLVKTSTADVWKLENDDASKVIRSTGAENGDNDGEHWTVLSGDGTKYVFGLDKLDGATTQRTNSTWTVPVFGDDSGEPGYSAGTAFADRSVTQAWRWNLDYVEDTRGNAATYWYTQEKNHYKKNKATKADAEYVRGGYLTEVKYGLRQNAVFTDTADAKVTFGYTERCTATDCTSLTKETSDNWPDVPFDAICAKDSTECLSQSPSFFTRKRLTGIDTFSWNKTATTYDPVDSWDFTQAYLDGGDIGDTSDHTLTLKSIKRTAKAGKTPVATDPVVFTYHMRPNRVDGTDDILPLSRPRISTVTSETGAITTVTTSSAECVRSQVLGAAEDTNTRNCYPQYWNINGASEASVDWFHKYRVLGVTTSDPAGRNDVVENEYVYSGAAWHYNDDPFTPTAERTWSDWRGYREVTVYKGAQKTGVPRSKTVSLYMQGMNGDKNKDGTTKARTVAPLAQPSVGIATLTDSNEYAGTLREQVVYNGTVPISVTANEPWSQETARQTDVPSAGDHVARYVRTEQATTYTYLTASDTWRRRAVQTTFDSYGMPSKVYDSGDYSKTGDETCSETWYARNDTVGLTNLVSRVRTVGLGCGFTEADLKLANADGTRGNVLSDTAMAYDNLGEWSASMTPTKGLATWTGRAAAYLTAGTVDWDKTADTAYDALGRPTKVTNANGKGTTTAYTPADSSGPLTRTVTTNAATHQVNTYLDPRRGNPLRTYDANLKKTELAYDALGRLTDVWLPNRSSSTQSPNTRFVYFLSNTKQSWVATSTLKADGETYNTGYTIYDALLRPLQTQSPTAQGGRLLTDTRYDSRGLAYETYADIFDSAATPNGTYARAEYGGAPKQTETVYDGAERPTDTSLYILGVKKWTTNTTYTGDSTATTALEGGSATRTIVDARGRTTETREYAGASPADAQYGATLSASYTSTKFWHTLDGKQTKITGPDGAAWSYTYDRFGRQKAAVDPDKGTTATDYDLLDRPTKTTTGGKTILTSYDDIDRPVNTWSGTQSDTTLLTNRTYDMVLKGLPYAATRYVGGKAGDAYIKTVTAYDVLSRPTTTELTLPAGDDLTASVPNGKLTYTTAYRIDGTVGSIREPSLGGLPAEIIEYGYGSVGQLTSMNGLTGYLQNADYSALGQVQQLTLGKGGTGDHNVYVTNTYETGTGRLTNSNVTDQTHPYMLQALSYTFDQAGNVTSIADPTILGGTGKAETQCFTYDGHRRLLEAWTPTSQNCGDTRAASTLSGPAPYWTSYTYNTAGQRKTETQHLVAGDTTTTYCYDPASQPHALRYTTPRTECGTTAPQTTDKVYDYDAAGNTTKRPGATGQQVLTWSDEGRLSKLTENGKSTDYLYDADGILLVRHTQDGERILYAGLTELHRRANGTTWAQRSYTAGGTQIAVRTNQSGATQLLFLAGDHHGSQSLAVGSDTEQKITKRYMTPFGSERGGAIGSWPTDKAFLNKTADSTTGLTHVGARQYDPLIGQFISVDPLLSPDQHQSLNGYSYANNSPVTQSDPTGLKSDECGSLYKCGGNQVITTSTTKYQDVQIVARHYEKTVPAKTQATWESQGPAQNGSWGKAYEVTDYRNENFDHNWSTNMWGGVGAWATSQSSVVLPGLFGMVHNALYEGWMATLGVDVNSSHYQNAQGFLDGFSLIAPGGAASFGARAAKLVGGCKCFLAGTDVKMADGSTKDIEAVKLGDQVLATDPETGESGPRKVTRLIVTEDDKHFNELSIETDDGPEKLTATHEHPFWSPSKQEWVEARHLAKGMTLLTDKGEIVQILGNRAFARHARTYNLTVDDLHTYYVLAGETPVLVHNSNCPGVGRDLIGGQEQFHIIHGDRTGGGHKWPGQPGKTVFPRGWDTDKILDSIADVATSPSSGRTQQTGRAGALYTRNGDPSRWKVEGVVDGVNIRVIYEPATGRVVTGFPYRP